jgi:hypothetical protein
MVSTCTVLRVVPPNIDAAMNLRGAMKDSGKTAADLDSARRSNMAYEYLCHLEEAKMYVPHLDAGCNSYSTLRAYRFTISPRVHHLDLFVCM